MPPMMSSRAGTRLKVMTPELKNPANPVASELGLRSSRSNSRTSGSWSWDVGDTRDEDRGGEARCHSRFMPLARPLAKRLLTVIMQALTCMPASTRTASLPTRQRLLDAAARVFAMQGLEGATTREIARQAKVNEVTLFRHFQSKEKLLGEVLRHTFDPPGTPASIPLLAAPPLRTRRRPASSLRGDLRRFAERYDLLLHRNILLIRTLLGEIHRHRKQEKRVLHGIFAPLKEELLAALQNAREQGKIRPEVEPIMAADLFSSMIFTGVLRRTSPYAAEYPSAQYLEAAVDTFVRGIER